MPTISVLLYTFLFFVNVSTKSVTVVIDTSNSMKEELELIKNNIDSVIKNIGFFSDIKNYILVPFKDPDVGPELYSQTSDHFITLLKRLTVSGGGNCPENTISAIEKALLVSNPESNIFVFTDANARDNEKFRSVKNLCRNKQSKVVIFLSGKCPLDDINQLSNINLYNDVAKSCSGYFLNLDFNNMRQALVLVMYIHRLMVRQLGVGAFGCSAQSFNFMKEVAIKEWSEIIYDTFIGIRYYNFTVDTLTTEVVVSVTGDNPVLQISDDDNSTIEIEDIVDTKNVLVVQIINLEVKMYKFHIRCTGAASVIFYRQRKIPFQYGFSTMLPKNIRETSSKPMPGWNNYIIIIVPNDLNVKLNKVQLRILYESYVKTLTLRQSNEDNEIYIAQELFEPHKYFKITFFCQDKLRDQEIIVTTKTIEPQVMVQNADWTKPSIQIIKPEPPLVDFGTNTTLACKVLAYPKPSIVWEDDSGNQLTSQDALLEIPSVFISYATIDNVTTNNTIIYCKAKNSNGEDSESIELFVNRTFTFDAIQTPQDSVFEYGEEGKLFCEINAYPDVTIKWLHNGTDLETSDNIEIVPDDNMLLIKNMSLNDIGTYTCETVNDVDMKAFSAEISISGLETPEVEIIKTELLLKPGDSTEVECRTKKGMPLPELIWTYKSYDGLDFTDIPEGVLVSGNILNITEANINHKGVYRCQAINAAGDDSKEISIKIQYPPKIKNDDVDILRVKEEEQVKLRCDVDAEPEARVRWEMSQDDLIVELDNRHSTDEHNTHSFISLWNDSGNYHCIAENDLGRAEKTITVNVLARPYINTTVTSIETSVGATVNLNCNIMFGYPAPTMRWEFTSVGSMRTVLSRGKSTSLLHLQNISKADEGAYTCVAENEIGFDSVTIELKVQ